MVPGMLTVREWAEQLGCSRAWVYAMMSRAKVRPLKVGAQWWLRPEDRDAIMARPRGTPGRPRKKPIDTV